jgi:hypothetical protein
MKIYGYELHSDEMVELQEISFQIDSQKLRMLSGFFAKTADIMDKHGEKFGHEHFNDFIDSKNDNSPDIIISK